MVLIHKLDSINILCVLNGSCILRYLKLDAGSAHLWFILNTGCIYCIYNFETRPVQQKSAKHVIMFGEWGGGGGGKERKVEKKKKNIFE